MCTGASLPITELMMKTFNPTGGVIRADGGIGEPSVPPTATELPLIAKNPPRSICLRLNAAVTWGLEPNDLIWMVGLNVTR